MAGGVGMPCKCVTSYGDFGMPTAFWGFTGGDLNTGDGLIVYMQFGLYLPGFVGFVFAWCLFLPLVVFVERDRGE